VDIFICSWLSHPGPLFHHYSILVFRLIPKGKIRRLKHRWEDNIRMDLRELEWEGVDWMYLAEDGDQWWAIMNMVMNLWVP
jgi:hypothetical protein